tara:strand:+ start:375 stop:1052 length:678 start_codon:yes stop_codon:yes gene_type:complete
MPRTTNVLIIEDEPMAIENYERALWHVENNVTEFKFNIKHATDCQMAYDKIKKAKKGIGLDLFILDIRLQPTADHKIRSGEDLGNIIRALLPQAKIIVITGYTDVFRLINIMKTIQPDGFLVKSDMVFMDVVTAIEKVMNHKNYYSHKVAALLKQRASDNTVLDAIDMQILYEISNGAKMKELQNLIALTKSAIDKRRRNLKVKFNVADGSDRDLILAAKEKGFI